MQKTPKGYFSELARRIRDAAPDEWARRGISDQIWGAHQVNIPGKIGIFEVIPDETAKWLKPAMEQFQKEWQSRFPDTDINVLSLQQTGDIQTLAEFLSQMDREEIQELLRGRL